LPVQMMVHCAGGWRRREVGRHRGAAGVGHHRLPAALIDGQDVVLSIWTPPSRVRLAMVYTSHRAERDAQRHSFNSRSEALRAI
jgi:hypothetical protein